MKEKLNIKIKKNCKRKLEDLLSQWTRRVSREPEEDEEENPTSKA